MSNISKKKWISFSVKNRDTDLKNQIYINFSNFILGTYENNNEFIFYFNSNIKNKLDSFKTDKAEINEIKYENWHAEFEKHFRPVEINSRITVVPDWYEANDLTKDYIYVKPGMAFGTGTHETTQLILSQIPNIIKNGHTVLDLGTGSGILAIGAIKSGAKHVTCYEYDLDCKENFYENMSLNGIKNFEISFSDVLQLNDFDYNCILANINEKIVRQLLPRIKKYRTNNSVIILSGIIDIYKEEIQNLIKKMNFKLIKTLTKNEWVCFIIS
tara:strand:+ start:28 stop:840 length:813 start_codon:yes stop_codon:yes gene_type:complete